MKSLWKDQEAAVFKGDPLQIRTYTSQLLGREPSLVLHGGGNTSVKINEKNYFGESEDILYVKGSGWDLATIEPKGFAPVKMEVLLKMARLEKLSDTDMVRLQRAAMTDPNAPAPSVEAILHAIIPFKYVDHTHSDAIVALTNTPNGEKLIREIFGDRLLYIPYVMPGFILARKVFELCQDAKWENFDGMLLLHHGIFSFSDDAKESYERMIGLVSEAENYLKQKKVFDLCLSHKAARPTNKTELQRKAFLRRALSKKAGFAGLVLTDTSPEALSFCQKDNVREFSQRGPLTPDHVLHTKRTPLFLEANADNNKTDEALNDFEKNYKSYFEKNSKALGLTDLKPMDPAPRWVIWPDTGILSFGPSAKRAEVVRDISRHTAKALQWAEALGSWVALNEKEIFEIEYWELEQAKLKKSGTPLALQGKVALVTGAASGIGRACVESLRAQGAAVAAVDINPEIEFLWKGVDILGIPCDLSKSENVEKAVAKTVENFGGLDILVANAGIFPASNKIDALDDEVWQRTLDLNLTSQMYLLRAAAPYLELGLDPAIIIMASKNVPAPGPGAAAYSASKAGLTQLARVAALELAPKGVRVHMLHPHAVMDTALWTAELLKARAEQYKMSVEEYKKNNLLSVEISSKDVADLVTAMAGPLFSKCTGTQIIIDGGNERTI